MYLYIPFSELCKCLHVAMESKHATMLQASFFFFNRNCDFPDIVTLQFAFPLNTFSCQQVVLPHPFLQAAEGSPVRIHHGFIYPRPHLMDTEVVYTWCISFLSFCPGFFVYFCKCSVLKITYGRQPPRGLVPGVLGAVVSYCGWDAWGRLGT